jgi:hypothetical protein
VASIIRVKMHNLEWDLAKKHTILVQSIFSLLV